VAASAASRIRNGSSGALKRLAASTSTTVQSDTGTSQNASGGRRAARVHAPATASSATIAKLTTAIQPTVLLVPCSPT